MILSVHLLQVFQSQFCFFLIDDAEGKADVNNHIVADFGFGNVGETDFFDDAAKADAAGARQGGITISVSGIINTDNFTRNC